MIAGKVTYDRFRGSEALIKERLRKYVQYFESCHDVLDIGCGRGEFLELLKEKKIPALGIDSDAGMVEICSRKGLSALHIDAFSFLKNKSETFDGIFCSHVIEHLNPQEAVDFLNLCRKALRPGGILIIITPNPQNIWVITNTFWLDLTHKRPYPLQLLKQLLKEREFEILASGEDKDTVGKGWKREIAKIILKMMRIDMNPFFSGQDIFVVSKKKGGNTLKQ